MIKIFWGASCGGSRKALQKAEEPNVMLSYQTNSNERWQEVENLFVDCGAYSMLQSNKDYTTSNADYLDHVISQEAEYWALRDYLCNKQFRYGRSVRDCQEKTMQRHRELLGLAQEHDVPGQPVSVIQGWELDDYLWHLDQMKDQDLLTDLVGIGSLKGRRDIEQVVDIIHAVRQELPSKYDLHGFGVNYSVLTRPLALNALDTADSGSYIRRARGHCQDRGISNTWQQKLRVYLNHREKIKDLYREKEIPEAQASVDSFVS